MKKTFYILIFLACTILSLQAQSFEADLNAQLFACGKNDPCACLEDDENLKAYRMEQTGQILHQIKQSSTAADLKALKAYYDKMDAAFTACWLGHYTFPQTLSNSANFDYQQLYYNFESTIRYLELNLQSGNPKEVVDETKKFIIGFAEKDNKVAQEWCNSFYNQKVFNSNNITVVYSLDAYFAHITTSFSTYETLLADDAANFKPAASITAEDRVFSTWRSIFIKAGASDKFLPILQAKEKSYDQAGRRAEYDFWVNKLGGN